MITHPEPHEDAKKLAPRIDTYGFNDLGYKIFLDRYALKDMTRESIKVGDVVIAILSDPTAGDMQGKRHVSVVTELTDDGYAHITTKEGGDYVVKKVHIDKPLETDPAQMQARIARGISSVEATEEKQTEWKVNFEWLLEDWKFVPGGRILTAAGTDQQLSSYNCFVIESPHDSREGIFNSLSEMAEIMSRGGGVGFNASSLRPRHAYVKGVNGRSSGAVSWGALFSYVTGLIEQAGCFAGDVRIATDRGLLKIEEIVDRVRNNGERIFAQTHQGLREIVDTFDNGVQPIYRITTSRGFQLDVTPNHPMLYLDGKEIVDIRADHLQIGDDVLLLNSNLNRNVSEFKFEAIGYKTTQPQTAHTVTLPEEMNPDLAYFLGYSYGDGYVQRTGHKGNKAKSLKLATADTYPEIRDKLVSIIKSEFDIDAVFENGDGNCTNVCTYSFEVMEWLDHNGILKEKSNNIRVPEAIFQSSSASQLAFIAGYFDADGGISIKKKNVKISSVAIEMLRDVQVILASNGIISQITTWERKEENWQGMNELSIRGNVHKARFSEMVPSVKDVTPAIGKRDMTNMYPVGVIDGSPVKYRQKIWDGNSERLSSNQLTKIATRAVDKYEDAEAGDRIDGLLQMTVDTVASIEVLEEEQTWDVTVADTHNLSANGMYTGNSRRGALMVILNDNHPDLMEFINSKRTMGQITNANISVGISDKFMKAVKNDEMWDFKFPDTLFDRYDDEWDGDLEAWEAKGYPVNIYDTIPAREIWNTIIESAWSSAEPGLWFRERSNKMSNSHYYKGGKLIATNPCGEIPLPANGVCNLGALNLGKFAIEPFAENGVSNVDWSALRQAVHFATRFLDNVVDYTYYVSEENEIQQKGERRLGLGSMGIAELMIRCGVRYGSKDAVEFAEAIYGFIAEQSYLASADIAAEKGSFPWFDASEHLKSGFMRNMSGNVCDAIAEHGARNVVILTVAPTGSIGTMMNTSTGIEPYFGWKWYRQGRLGWHEENAAIVQEYLDEKGIVPQESEDASLYLPDYFVTAMELTPYEHVAVMAAAQRWIDSAISKTINAPNDYTISQTAELYMHMYELGAKGGTIYRDGSRDEQVLHRADSSEDAKDDDNFAEITEVSIGNIVAQQEHIVPAHRPEILSGETFKANTPVGTAYIIINRDNTGQPFEVFIEVGKAGSDVQAAAESMGRLISIGLQMLPPHLRYEALSEYVSQLAGIGGSRQIGFGPNRVISLQDAVAQSIQKNYFNRMVVAHTNGHTAKGSVDDARVVVEITDGEREPVIETPGADKATGFSLSSLNGSGPKPLTIAGYDPELCPSCGNMSLLRQDGCKKCNICEYSEC